MSGRSRTRWLIGCVLACGCACAAAHQQGGVRGRVTLAPACAGAQSADADCRAPYADSQLELIAAGGAVTASARTGTDGGYEMTAPPGRYRLRVRVRGKLPRCPSPQVEIGAHGRTVADIECDSGMR